MRRRDCDARAARSRASLAGTDSSAAPPLVINDEVERAFWVPLARLAEPGVRRDVKLIVGGAARIFPAYDLGEDVIWGMTERILTPLLTLLDLIHNSSV